MQVFEFSAKASMVKIKHTHREKEFKMELTFSQVTEKLAAISKGPLAKYIKGTSVYGFSGGQIHAMACSTASQSNRSLVPVGIFRLMEDSKTMLCSECYQDALKLRIIEDSSNPIMDHVSLERVMTESDFLTSGFDFHTRQENLTFEENINFLESIKLLDGVYAFSKKAYHRLSVPTDYAKISKVRKSIASYLVETYPQESEDYCLSSSSTGSDFLGLNLGELFDEASKAGKDNELRELLSSIANVRKGDSSVTLHRVFPSVDDETDPVNLVFGAIMRAKNPNSKYWQVPTAYKNFVSSRKIKVEPGGLTISKAMSASELATFNTLVDLHAEDYYYEGAQEAAYQSVMSLK